MRRYHLPILGAAAIAPALAYAAPAYTIVDLGDLGGGLSVGNDISANGQVTGYSHIAQDAPPHAFLWDPATGIHDLGTLGEKYSSGTGINSRGQVTGESTAADGNNAHSCGTR